MAAGDINDALTNIPNVVLVDQTDASAAPGAGYARLEVVDGVLGVRVGTGAWVALVSLVAGLLTSLTEKATPADTDLLLLQDEAAASALKKVQVGNLPGGGAVTPLYNAYAMVSCRKSQGTYDGPITINTWTARVLNTEDADPSGILTLASNQITLEAGTYRFLVVAPFSQAGAATIRLYNTTGSVELLRSSVTYMTGAEADATQVVLQGRVTVAASQALEVQYRASNNPGDQGLGTLMSSGGETYTVVEIWRETPA